MVKVNGVTKYFGTTKVIDDISFQLKKGDVTGLLGPNGAGKTTTMRMITSYYFPNKGKIQINDKDTQADTLETQKLIGYLPENNPLYYDMIVYDFLLMSAKLNGVTGKTAHERIIETSKKIAISDKLTKNIGELSKGYKQRVGLASTLLHKPSVLILDEPTEGLDPVQRDEIRNLIKELSKETTILLSTHVLQEVRAMCNNVIVINKGKVVASGKPENLSVKKGYRLQLEGADIKEKLSKLLSKDDILKIDKEEKGKKNIYIQSSEELRPQISKLATENKWTIWELQMEDSIEEVFKELVK